MFQKTNYCYSNKNKCRKNESYNYMASDSKSVRYHTEHGLQLAVDCSAGLGPWVVLSRRECESVERRVDRYPLELRRLLLVFKGKKFAATPDHVRD